MRVCARTSACFVYDSIKKEPIIAIDKNKVRKKSFPFQSTLPK